jgi:hypothetical protein
MVNANKKQGKRNRTWYDLLVSTATIRTTLIRWKFSEKDKNYGQHFSEWGDYVQLMYTSCLAVSLGSLLSWLGGADLKDFNFDIRLAVIMLTLLGLAIYNDVRKWFYEKKMYNY